MIITETKLDETYPISQFHIDGYSMPYRLDRNRNDGGVIIYAREDIRSKVLRKHLFLNDIEGIFVEINFRKRKWLFAVLITLHHNLINAILITYTKR